MSVLLTGVFEEFIASGRLDLEEMADLTDEQIARHFQKADFPVEFLGDLRALVEEVHQPLAVRSSSLLEDALHHPFAGVYGTKMIPNNELDADTRFRKLLEAINLLVYASTFSRGARAILRAVGRSPADEKDGGHHPGGRGAAPAGYDSIPTLSGVGPLLQLLCVRVMPVRGGRGGGGFGSRPGQDHRGRW